MELDHGQIAQARTYDGPKSPAVDAASSLLDDGLNRLGAEIDQLEARLSYVLLPSNDNEVNPSMEPPTALHGQVQRLHRLAESLGALSRRIAL